jgi:hypothetical protein
MPFPGISGGTVTKRGVKISQISDGTAYTLLLAESREENATSWYSGKATYAVGHWPNSPAYPGSAGPPPDPMQNAQFPGALPATATAPAQWSTNFPSINRGHVDAAETMQVYFQANPHGVTPIRWGPSSRHDRVVIHAFADNHADPIRDDIDGDAYIRWVTRAGREISQAE